MPAFPLTPNKLRTSICLGLALITLALYWPVTHHDFINVDDPRFVTENPQVQAGLTWPGAVWAFKSVYTESWQPVTWFSHMLDCQLYGLNPAGHHVTSLLFHIANTLLLFLWLENLTKATARSAFVAAFFAWHPLHVESVAWVCERKDVLSAFFWLLALMAYTRYARKPGIGFYLLVVLLFVLGLMSKPMAITLPCVMLLLDFWPFNRFGLPFIGGGEKIGPGEASRGPTAHFDVARLVRKTALLVAEKIPFFVIAMAMSAATLYAQSVGGSLASLGGFPLHIRVANALVSYLTYLTKIFCPTDLAYFYPYTFNLPLASVIGGALLLTVWTGCLLLRVRQQPYLLVGWLWFVGTLVPTIGLVQFCIQSHADRYTYIPSIGLFIVVVWGLSDLFARWPDKRKYLPVLGGLALAGCLVVSSIQLTYWQNSITVSRHAIEVTDNNYVAYESVGRALTAMHHPEASTNFFDEAVRLAPDWPQGQFNFGITLAKLHQTNEAIKHLEAAIKLAPGFAEGHDRLGHVLLNFGKTDAAIQEFAEVIRLDPTFTDAQWRWGAALAIENKTGEALPHLYEAVRLSPNDPDIRFDLGLALLDAHQPAQAAEQFAAELKLKPDETKAHYRLAQALEQQGQFSGAIQHYRAALLRTPDFPEAKTALNRLLAAHPDVK
jgi:Tfp pilus assembly protein PilF